MITFGIEDQEIVFEGIYIVNHELEFHRLLRPRAVERDHTINRNPLSLDFSTNTIMSAVDQDDSSVELVNRTYVTSASAGDSNTAGVAAPLLFSLDLRSSGGAISLSHGLEGCAFRIGDGVLDTHIQLSATLSSINKALSRIMFLPAKNLNSWEGSNGLVSIEVEVSDGVSASARSVVNIAVEPQSDTPILTLPGEVLERFKQDDPHNFFVSSAMPVMIDEDTEYSLASISVNVVDATQNPSQRCTLSIKAYYGSIRSR